MSFQNPTGYWEHQGAYSVELTPEAETNRVPEGVRVNGTVVTVEVGRVKQTMGGIQLYALEKPFYWGYSYIRCIRDGDGKLLWVNNNCRDEITE